MRVTLRLRVNPRPAPASARLIPLVVASIACLSTSLTRAAVDPVWHPAAAARLGAAPASITLQTLEPAAPGGQPTTLDVLLDGRALRARLEPSSLRSAQFRVFVQRAGGTLEPFVVPPAATWRGRLEGVPGSSVEAALVAGEWHATLHLPRPGEEPDAWAVTPLALVVPGAPPGVSVVARVRDLAAPPGSCALMDSRKEVPEEASPDDIERLRALSPQQMQVFLLACDADSEYYALNGRSVPNTVADIEAVINGAQAIYERDIQLTVQIGTIIVRTAEPDPYSSTNLSVLLGQMRTEWKTNQAAVPRDVAQLFTGKDLDGTPIGNAYLDGMCSNDTGYSLVQSRFSTLLDNRVLVSTHEIAHNIDATHCDYDDYNCRIMCSSINGCSGGIRSFGPVEVGWLRSWLPRCACLDTTTVQVNHATLPLSDAFPGMVLDATKWTGADRYTVQYGRLELSHKPGYSGAVWLGTARTLPITLLGFPTLSYKIVSSGVAAGQQLWAEYFETRTLKWKLLNRIISPGGVAGPYTLYTHTLGDSARGSLFALRFTAYGSTGTTGAQWNIDDVSITEDVSGVTERVPPPPGRLLLQVQPNPFAERTALTFALDAPARVRLELFDLRGARVRMLLDGTVPAGRHAYSWDGRDAAGMPVPSGVYLARLRVGAADSVTRVLRLR